MCACDDELRVRHRTLRRRQLLASVVRNLPRRALYSRRLGREVEGGGGPLASPSS